jgi:flavin-dependent dehydrogenase
MTEIAIVGGGLAGCAAAITLARHGREVLLIEREPRPHHKVCGEFLSREALDTLRSLGVEPAEFGAATLHSVRLADAQRVTASVLPFAAMSLTRRRLDEELLRLAQRVGVYTLRGVRVQRLQRRAGAWEAKLDGGELVTAKTAFLATGKHDLQGLPRPAGVQPWMVGFKMYYRLELRQAEALAGHVELALFRGGYGGLQPVEDGAANLCCLVHRDELQRLGGKWENLLEAMRRDCPHLRERLAGAEPLLERPLAVSHIPYGFVRRRTDDGLWCLGDQAAVIPSFTGDGMSIALHSGQLAAEMYLAGESADVFQKRLQSQVGQQVALATMVSKGLVWGPSRGVFSQMVRMCPSLLGIVARRTRVRDEFRLA